MYLVGGDGITYVRISYCMLLQHDFLDHIELHAEF